MLLCASSSAPIKSQSSDTMTFAASKRNTGRTGLPNASEGDSAAARWHSGRVKLRDAVHVIFGHFAEGIDSLLGAAAAGSAEPKTGEQERGRHDFHEMPAGDRVGPFAGAGGELPLEPILKLR